MINISNVSHKEIILEQPFFNNFYNKFLLYLHCVFTLFFVFHIKDISTQIWTTKPYYCIF